MLLSFRVSVSAIVIAMISSCANNSSKEALDSAMMTFIGLDVEQAKTRMGTPNQVYDMQNGTLEYIWVQRKGGGNSTGYNGVAIASSGNKSCNKVLITNEDKVIVGYRLEGKTCR